MGTPHLGRNVIVGFGTRRGCTASKFSTTFFHSLYHHTGIPARAFAGEDSVPNNSALKGVSGAGISVPAISVKLPRLTVRSSCRATNAGSATCLIVTYATLFRWTMLFICERWGRALQGCGFVTISIFVTCTSTSSDSFAWNFVSVELLPSVTSDPVAGDLFFSHLADLAARGLVKFNQYNRQLTGAPWNSFTRNNAIYETIQSTS